MDCVLEILLPNCDKNVSLDIFALSFASREPHDKYYLRIKYSKLPKIYLEKENCGLKDMLDI